MLITYIRVVQLIISLFLGNLHPLLKYVEEGVTEGFISINPLFWVNHEALVEEIPEGLKCLPILNLMSCIL